VAAGTPIVGGATGDFDLRSRPPEPTGIGRPGAGGRRPDRPPVAIHDDD
jgi:hypothetical protein